MVKTGLISMERLVEIMSVNPRKILGLPCSDGIKAGNPADITILDTETEQIVDPATFRTKGRATTYAGMLLQGSIAALLYKGVQVL